jgi:preprotein translocase subunit SecD
MRAGLMGVLALAGFVSGASAAGKPVIEIHAVVDCHAADSVKPADPAADGDCMARTALVRAADFTGIGHVRFGRGQDMLVLAMNDAGRRRFYDYVRAHAEQPVAVLVDGRVVSMPVVSEPAQPDTLEIPGLTSGQIDLLVARFRAPAHGG